MSNEQDRKDKVTAQIALGLGNSRAAQTCLDEETLAAFVDHRLEGPALKQAQQQIANCSHCYSQWRELSQAIAQLAPAKTRQAAEDKAGFWQSLANSWMNWAGGSIAIAAAAIMAVNIIPMADPQAGIDDIYQQYGHELASQQDSQAKSFEHHIQANPQSWSQQQIAIGKTQGREKLGLSPGTLPQNDLLSCQYGSDCGKAEVQLRALGQWLFITELQCQSEYSADEHFWQQQADNAQALAKQLQDIEPTLARKLDQAKATEHSLCRIIR